MKNVKNSNEETKLKNIPQWMLTADSLGEEKAGKINIGFLRRTLSGISKVIQNDLMSERLSVRKGLLQRIDPRLKLLILLFYMVFAGATGSIFTLVLLAGVAAVTAGMSGLGLVSYFKRVWCILPLIVLAISIPAATNLIIKGKPVFYLSSSLYFTWEGIKAALKMALRIGDSFSFGYILITTTRWSQLTKALTVLKVPRLLVSILDMTYRYIFVLSRLSIEMFEARFLRTVGKISNRDNRKFISRGMAFLFIKSNYLSEEIYDSMICRGYAGEPVSLRKFRFTSNDFVWLLNNIIILFVLVLGARFFG